MAAPCVVHGKHRDRQPSRGHLCLVRFLPATGGATSGPSAAAKIAPGEDLLALQRLNLQPAINRHRATVRHCDPRVHAQRVGREHH